MIRKPGEVDRSTVSGVRSVRKSNESSPDDEIRKLQRLAINKKCADCSAKLPQAVNLTHGSFICLMCAGLHREFNHRIKGIGHSSFTAEEADFVAAHGNEKVNNMYLFKHDSNYDRMNTPDATYGDVDPVLLRTWIRRKYIDRVWYKNDISLEEKLGRSPKVPAGDQTTSKATIVKVPPKTAHAPPLTDFFLDDVKSETVPVAANVDELWDAFGTKSSQFDANFGTSDTQVAPQETLFHADFDQLNLRQPSEVVGLHVQPEILVTSQALGPAVLDSRDQLELSHLALTRQSDFTPSNTSSIQHTSYPMTSTNNLTSQPNINVQFDAIGAAFDSLVDPMVGTSNVQANSHGPYTFPTEQVNEINVLLRKCTQQQLHLVSKYIQQLLAQQPNSHGVVALPSLHMDEKLGRPYDF